MTALIGCPAKWKLFGQKLFFSKEKRFFKKQYSLKEEYENMYIL